MARSAGCGRELWPGCLGCQSAMGGVGGGQAHTCVAAAAAGAAACAFVRRVVARPLMCFGAPVQGFDKGTQSVGKTKVKFRKAPKSDNVYIKLLVKVLLLFSLLRAAACRTA